MKLKLFIATLAFGVRALGVSSSCKKKTDCKVIVTTLDSAGNVLSGATVKLYANVKTSSGATIEANLKAESVSDGVGTSTFTFKLPAILDVKAVYGTKKGIGIIKLEEGETVEKVITVK